MHSFIKLCHDGRSMWNERASVCFKQSARALTYMNIFVIFQNWKYKNRTYFTQELATFKLPPSFFILHTFFVYRNMRNYCPKVYNETCTMQLLTTNVMTNDLNMFFKCQCLKIPCLLLPKLNSKLKLKIICKSTGTFNIKHTLHFDWFPSSIRKKFFF